MRVAEKRPYFSSAACTALLVLALALFVFTLSREVAQAGDSENHDDTAVCWVSRHSGALGGVGDAGDAQDFGHRHFFAVDLDYVMSYFSDVSLIRPGDNKDEGTADQYAERLDTPADYIDSAFAATHADVLLLRPANSSPPTPPDPVVRYGPEWLYLDEYLHLGTVEFGVDGDDPSRYREVDRGSLKAQRDGLSQSLYFSHRQVARNKDEEDRVTRFEALWQDPYSSQGGSVMDEQESLQLGASFQASMMMGLNRTASGGFRQHTTSGTAPVVEQSTSASSNCSLSSGACVFNLNSTPNTVDASVVSTTIDQNVGETMLPAFVDTEVDRTAHSGQIVRNRRVGIEEQMRAYPGHGYNDLAMSEDFSVQVPSDGVDNALKVEIDLDVSYRSDVKAMRTDGGPWEVARAFGLNPFTHRAYGSMGWARDRTTLSAGMLSLGAGGSFICPGDSPIADAGNPPRAMSDCRSELYLSSSHVGFRQPVIGDVWAFQPLADAEEAVDPTVYPQLEALPKRFYSMPLVADQSSSYWNVSQPVDGSGLLPYLPNSDVYAADNGAGWNQNYWRMIRWPVNFEDLNWYLFALPGGNIRQGDSYSIRSGHDHDQATAFWLTNEGRHRILASGYTTFAESFSDSETFSHCGYTLEEDENALGGSPSRSTAKCLSGQGGKYSNVNQNPGVDALGGDAWGGVLWNGDKLRQGRLNVRGYAPFDIYGINEPGSWNNGVQPDTLDDFLFRSVRFGPGLADDTPPPVLAVRAGVESPVDASKPVGEDSVRWLNSFRFVIDERTSALSEALKGGATDRTRIGFPAQFSTAPADTGSSSQDISSSFLSSWPTHPLDPSRAHLLVYTYYERWTEKHGAYDGKPGQLEYRSDEKDGKVRVPKQYFRRVICRSFVWPLGFSPSGNMVSQAWDAVTGRLGNILGGLSAIFRFISKGWNAVGGAPEMVAGQAITYACEGVDVAQEWIADPALRPTYESLGVSGSGIIESNKQLEQKEAFKADCLLGQTAELQGSCDTLASDTDRARCARLPRLSITPVGRNDGSVRFVDKFDVRFNHYFVTGSEYLRTSYATYNVRHPSRVHRGGILKLDCFVGVEESSCLADDGDRDPIDYSTLSGLTTVGAGTRGFVPLYSFSDERGNPTFWKRDVKLVNVFRDIPKDASRVDPGDSRSVSDSGLTRLKFEFEASVDLPSVRSFEGYYISILADNASLSVPGIQSFHIPRQYQSHFYETFESHLDNAVCADDEYIKTVDVDGIYFGALGGAGHYGREGDVDHILGSFDVDYRANALCYPEITPLGSSVEQDDVHRMNALLAGYPLAPGYDYHMLVRAYRGTPGGDVIYGPPSDILVIRGHQAACYLDFNETVLGLDDLGRSTVDNIYACGDIEHAAAVPDDLRVGLLPLVGNKICNDLFTATQGGFSYENPVVIIVWRIMLVVASSLLFFLFMWQGLKMTYDTWIEPRPSMGFRELVPRFLLCLGLVAGSLYICKWAIVLAGDLTCFVSQATGMSFWGVLSAVFLPVLRGYFDMTGNGALAVLFLIPIVGKILMFITFFILLFMLIFIGYAFFKVMIAMLFRLALIAVLVAFSPIAFALYASDSTEHWTKKWVSMFLGALFQQVVVLVVFYIGGGLLDYYFNQNDDPWTGGTSLFTGFFISLMILAAADRVPHLINPAGMGLFASFGQMAKMSMAAAATLAGGAAGLVSGAGGSSLQVAGAGGAGGGAPAGAAPAGGAPAGGVPAGAAPAGAAPAGGVGGTGGAGGAGLASRAGAFASSRYTGMIQGMRQGRQVGSTLGAISDGSIWTRNRSTRDESAEAIQQLNTTLRRSNRGGP